MTAGQARTIAAQVKYKTLEGILILIDAKSKIGEFYLDVDLLPQSNTEEIMSQLNKRGFVVSKKRQSDSFETWDRLMINWA